MIDILEMCKTAEKFPAKHLIYPDNVLLFLDKIFQNHYDDIGFIAEFGVFGGLTINHISKTTPQKIVHGFDTFFGIPYDWTSYSGKGTFNRGGNPPKVNNNVKLYPGLFKYTIPMFLREDTSKAAFIHIDCDCYQSTKEVLELLYPRMVIGTILHFDELINYKEFEDHEIKALSEFLQRTGIELKCLGVADGHQQVSFKVVKI